MSNVLTNKEIVELLEEYKKNFEEDYGEESLAYFVYELAENYSSLDRNCNRYTHIMQEGGDEGGGEYCEAVFTLDDRYFRCSYNYYSYDGHDYDDILDTLQQVFPKEVTVTKYVTESEL